LLVVKEDDLKTLIKKSAGDQIDTQKQAILSYGINDANYKPGSKKGTKTPVAVTTQVVAGPEINQDAIKKDAFTKDRKLMTPLMLAVANADIQMTHLILSRNPAMLTRVGTPEKDVMDIVLEHENKHKCQALMDIIYQAYSKAITERY
jgi:hypothetical protein